METRQYYRIKLPNHGVPSFISDLTSLSSSLCGKSVRVIGRVEQYNASSNEAMLSEPNNSSAKLLVNASFTDADNFRPGSLVMLIGELEVASPMFSVIDTKRAKLDNVTHRNCRDLDNNMRDGLDGDEDDTQGSTQQEISVKLTARVAHCVDRLDYSVYRQAVQVWRDLGRSCLHSE
ncbi:hypothetical protein ElyMa_001011100 [Elysia marginata]|uniref:CST complex subunit Stn1 N-terminal domain-containing protein n=1 Tax=Elysia marginata TaxID=1093978 RepID=A0AAV4HJS3_9GAST|nr:hypothetical protein ElyMa_001011100 [Elysia marginata]